MKRAAWKKLMMLLAVMALCFMAGLFASPAKVEAAAKVKLVLEFKDGTKKTWKTGDKKISLGKKKLAYIYFGSYPQTEVKGSKLTKAIKKAKYNKDGVATVNGTKYKRISKEDATYDNSGLIQYYDWTDKKYAYFKFEPIKWRVLSNKNGTALLLSEYGIDTQKFNNEDYAATNWMLCSLRTWLNYDFALMGFTAAERKMINCTTNKNADNPRYGTYAGGETEEWIYPLSLDEALNKKYGFSDNGFYSDEGRATIATDFAIAMGAYIMDYSSYLDTVKSDEDTKLAYWWLRSPGQAEALAIRVSYDGSINYSGTFAYEDICTVRPALRLNLKKVIK